MDVDTTTDVYSLSVLLYELLVGVLPFTLWAVPVAQRLRTIRETRRRITVRALRELLRGALNWIVEKALEKERSHRYQSVADLAADVERYLKREAVIWKRVLRPDHVNTASH